MQAYSYLTGPLWKKIGIYHHHGICTPLSSLYTASSCGIGEYLDLLPLLEWLKRTGFNTLQLLPLNDTRDDPSPYMCISSIALHPIYLSLEALPMGGNELPAFQKILQELKSLNPANRVAYHEVLHKKMAALSIYLSHNLSHIEENQAFHEFIKKHRSWLMPYAFFSALKKAHQGKAWWDWDPSLHLNKTELCRDDMPLAKEIHFWQAIQYLCFSQFAQVRAAADRLGIHLVGDIPILINKDSADVFWHQDLFSFDKVVGAPPDMYNREGQYWGFPLFRWPQHKKEHFAWWKERLTAQEELYHMYRLDHIVGFFRLWAIPPGKPAKDGYFLPKTPPEWKRLGETVLKTLVQATNMFPIGEDLGDIPDLVRSTLQQLGIPGMKVLRWERKWHKDQSFIPPRSFSPESLTTISTHDSSTLGSWWKEAPQECATMARDFNLPYTRRLTKSLRRKILELTHTSGSLFHVNLLSEYLALFPDLSWNNPSLDRINTPGTLSPSNWTFRYKVPLEKIIEHKGLTTMLQSFSQQ
jgi:4-alpha-glucanotransferase